MNVTPPRKPVGGGGAWSPVSRNRTQSSIKSIEMGRLFCTVTLCMWEPIHQATDSRTHVSFCPYNHLKRDRVVWAARKNTVDGGNQRFVCPRWCFTRYSGMPTHCSSRELRLLGLCTERALTQAYTWNSIIWVIASGSGEVLPTKKAKLGSPWAFCTRNHRAKSLLLQGLLC